MKRIWPQTLRYKLILLILLSVLVPMLITGYIVKKEAEESILAEKRTKLFGIARLLDAYLGDGFNPILASKNAIQLDRISQIKILNAALSFQTDLVAQNEPGVGVGYYSKDLDAIITYGPSEQYAGTVGLSIDPSHPGRKVMEEGISLVEFGPLVRGNIMNAMIPIKRNNQVIGYIWANELTDNVQAQLEAIDRKIYLFGCIGILICVSLMFLVIGKFINDVETIKEGLQNLRYNLTNRIRPLRGETGEIAEAINQMAQSLWDVRSVNENILYSIADGVITVDNEGRITTINPAAQEMTGYAPEELVGKFYSEVFCEGKHFSSRLLDTLVTGSNYVGLETEYPVKGKAIYISISTSRLRDQNGQIIGAVVVFKDLTEKHRLEEQVHRADRLATLGEMMAGIAHEIRNPLTSIKGFVQYLQELDGEEERREYMPVIVKEVDRVNRVIDELLYFARPNRTEYQKLDMNELIAKTMFLVKNKTTKHRVEFQLELSEDLPKVEADANQMRQVLLNLMINSIQAIPDKGTVTIRTWIKDNKSIFIEIRDNGQGIRAADLDKVFDPFFTTKPAGTGLGLAVVQRIIADHHGRIKISGEPNAGTSVIIELPVLQERSLEDEG